MSSPGSATTRRVFLSGVVAFGAAAGLVGCGGETKETGTLVKEDPQQKQAVNDMTKFYESNPPGTPAKK